MSAISAVATRLTHESITAISPDVALLPFLSTTKLGGEARDLVILQLDLERSQVRQLQWDIASQLITCEVDKVGLARRGEEVRGDRSLDVVVIEGQIFKKMAGRAHLSACGARFFGPLPLAAVSRWPRPFVTSGHLGSWCWKITGVP